MPKDTMTSNAQPDDVQQLTARVEALEYQFGLLAKTEMTKAEPFSETLLVDALRTAKPGDRLNFENVNPNQMEAAVRALSEPEDSQNNAQPGLQIARDAFDLGPHVSQVSYWWGVRIELDHEAMQVLAKGGAAAALAAVGVNPFVGGIIAGVIAIWAAHDRGNGVIFFVTWTGVHWFTPR